MLSLPDFAPVSEDITLALAAKVGACKASSAMRQTSTTVPDRPVRERIDGRGVNIENPDSNLSDTLTPAQLYRIRPSARNGRFRPE